ncbi:MAG: FecCD family ABC transporter permease [Ancrocorticia populi]|uniref:FecCD family ABC transporter permease n=1 Tax=Ancrocorticia populi TaxID=2175228 RepID=UPI003F93A390
MLLLGSVLFGIGSGSVSLSPTQVIDGLFGGAEQRVVWDLRLPRVILGGLVGMSLAVSGLILQAVMMNPLADPGIIGISSGAGLFGIVILLAFPALYTSVPIFAFCGAMLAAIVIYALAWRGGIQPMRVILAGVAVSALCGAGISAVMVFFSDRVQGALLFMNGSLSMRGWSEVRLLLPYALIGVLAALVCSRRLNLIVLGDDVARSMGMNVQANRLFLTAIAAMLAAGAVSTVGLLGFVGLIVPHLVRLILGNNHTLLVPATALCGAGLVIFSDTIARTLFSPAEIPVGICMAILGVPFFLYFLRKAM